MMCVPQKLASDTADKDTSPGRYNYQYDTPSASVSSDLNALYKSVIIIIIISVHTTQRHTAKAVSTSAALIN